MPVENETGLGAQGDASETETVGTGSGAALRWSGNRSLTPNYLPRSTIRKSMGWKTTPIKSRKKKAKAKSPPSKKLYKPRLEDNQFFLLEDFTLKAPVTLSDSKALAENTDNSTPVDSLSNANNTPRTGSRSDNISNASILTHHYLPRTTGRKSVESGWKTTQIKSSRKKAKAKSPPSKKVYKPRLEDNQFFLLEAFTLKAPVTLSDSKAVAENTDNSTPTDILSNANITPSTGSHTDNLYNATINNIDRNITRNTDRNKEGNKTVEHSGSLAHTDNTDNDDDDDDDHNGCNNNDTEDQLNLEIMSSGEESKDHKVKVKELLPEAVLRLNEEPTPMSRDIVRPIDGNGGKAINTDIDRNIDMDRNIDGDMDRGGENDSDRNDDDEGDDDDEDNWSRQVETDEILQRVPSSVTGGETATTDGDEHNHHHSEGDALLPQPRPQPTMKEKLVERERQRRVESERARWKRQFAMAAHAELEQEREEHPGGSGSGGESPRGSASVSGERPTEDPDRSFAKGPNSVAGTVGEDTVAPIETLEEEAEAANMNYPMERFLKEQQQGEGMEHHGDGGSIDIGGENPLLGNQQEATSQVVMERFLQEPPSAAAGPYGGGIAGSSPPSSPAATQRMGDALVDAAIPAHHGIVEASSEDALVVEPMPGDHPFQSPSQQPRVVLRLTEAEIQEMAAIDDASRSNAPPSERDDMSELGELVSGFGLVHLDNQNMSQGTPVTAMESVTSSMGNPVLDGSSSGHGGIDGIEGHSVSSNVVASSAGGDVSLTGNPPSDIARDDDDDDDDDATRGMCSPRSPRVPTEILPGPHPSVGRPMPSLVTSPVAGATEPLPGARLGLIAPDETIVNRRVRPGMFGYKEPQHRQHHQQEGPIALKSRPEAPLSTPEKIPATRGETDNKNIDGFDFDKDSYSPSIGNGQNGVVLVRNEMWSPGLSTDCGGGAIAVDDGLDDSEDDDHRHTIPSYGAAPGAHGNDHGIESQRFGSGDGGGEARPLLKGILPVVDVPVQQSRRFSWNSFRSIRNTDDLNSLAESLFSDIRSESTATRMSISNEAEDYLACSVFQRAFPERMFALTVTLVFEMPTLFMISGGSDRLCGLIGRTRYTTLVALLPIVSAVSGNVGLQASTLTTRAISHGQVKVANYTNWLFREVGAALYLGLGNGVVTGFIAFLMGGFSVPFALSIASAQFIGIVTAGCTGTLAPLLFTFIFEKDSGKWGGPLETAVQDVVGSFAMIVISYRIMLWFGPYEIEPEDACSVVPAVD